MSPTASNAIRTIDAGLDQAATRRVVDDVPPYAASRIALTYWWRHGRWPRLAAPTRFTELVQQRKLADRDPRLPLLADKLLVKDHVADALGSEWVIPTLWRGTRLPPAANWPLPFVVKSRHGCNQRAFVRSEQQDWAQVGAAAASWMRRPYGLWLDEWLYRAIPRGLLVEPMVGARGVLPIDYKFYVFGGRVAYIQVHLEREHAHRWVVLDRAWRPIAPGCDGDVPSRPVTLPAMIAAAETLGDTFEFVRVDLYEVAGQPLFGEMTFYPGSGLDRFDPVRLDIDMGACWLGVRHQRGTRCAVSTI